MAAPINAPPTIIRRTVLSDCGGLLGGEDSSVDSGLASIKALMKLICYQLLMCHRVA